MTESGVVFPLSSDDGSTRSTSALGRTVVADALRSIDPIGARAAEQETNWRGEYVGHFRRLIEAGLTSGQAARRSSADGLTSLHDRMRVITPDRGEIGLRSLFAVDPDPARELATVAMAGSGEAETSFSLPVGGQRLRGDEIHRQLDAWLTAGIIEPSCAEAVRLVMANPSWLRLDGRTVAVLGAGAEMGPLRSLLRWGADVVAIDLPRPAIWSTLMELPSRMAGTLRIPVPAKTPTTERAGADLLHDLPAVAALLRGVDGPLVLGNYVYADGATNVRVSVAVDALCAELTRQRSDVALAFLATPTDAFAVPGEAVEQAEAAYRQSGLLKKLRQPLRLVSAGRLLRRNYPPGADPGICDSLVPQQGPNYALAKRLQRWRAAVAREAGTAVSFKVAPPTRTRSVIKNRALAAAYAGAHAFGVTVFEPATSNTLMAVLLVHDLHHPAPHREHVWEEEADGAAHGGLWRAPYAPRSALGLAAMIGFSSARS